MLTMMSAMMFPEMADRIYPDLRGKSRNDEEYYKSKGMRKFFYGENSLWAINQRSADRKARKLNWIK